MTPGQIGILNSLVTYAAENVPGGLRREERAVAQIVGRMTLYGGQHRALLTAAKRVEELVGVKDQLSLPEDRAHVCEVIFP